MLFLTKANAHRYGFQLFVPIEICFQFFDLAWGNHRMFYCVCFCMGKSFSLLSGFWLTFSWCAPSLPPWDPQPPGKASNCWWKQMTASLQVAPLASSRPRHDARGQTSKNPKSLCSSTSQLPKFSQISLGLNDPKEFKGKPKKNTFSLYHVHPVLPQYNFSIFWPTLAPETAPCHGDLRSRPLRPEPPLHRQQLAPLRAPGSWRNCLKSKASANNSKAVLQQLLKSVGMLVSWHTSKIGHHMRFQPSRPRSRHASLMVPCTSLSKLPRACFSWEWPPLKTTHIQSLQSYSCKTKIAVPIAEDHIARVWLSFFTSAAWV